MTRGMIYKLLFILLLIGFSIVLILPTIGEKTMRIIMNGDATAEQTQAVKQRFPAAEYTLVQKGGMHLVLQADFKKIENKSADKKKLSEKDKTDLTQQALELIRNRIDKFGVAEPSIRPRGSDAIEIQLPGVKDPRAVQKAIGTTGRVEYRLVDDAYTT